MSSPLVDKNFLQLNVLGIKIRVRKSKILDYTSGPYGMYDIAKEYMQFQFWFSGCHVWHGWGPMDWNCKSDIVAAKKLMLCMSTRDKTIFDTTGKAPSVVAGSLFTHYRRLHNITQAEDARGTIAYPAHSVRDMLPAFDMEQYCLDLKALPEKFHPITVSLHPCDIDFFHLDKVYQKHGFKTVCAGKLNERPFYENFYELLRHHKYATSNEPGSYSFYAVEMGIPFFIHGENPLRDNRHGKIEDLPKTSFRVSDMFYGKIAYEIFSDGAKGHISEKQLEYVISELGLEDCLSPEELRAAFFDVMRKSVRGTTLLPLLLSFFTMSLRYPMSIPDLPKLFYLFWQHYHKRNNAKDLRDKYERKF